MQTVEEWERRAEELRIRSEIISWEYRIAQLRFNPYHDEKGRFATADVDKGSESGIIKKEKGAQNLYVKQSEKALRSGIKKDMQQIAKHIDKICDPSKYVTNWDSRNAQYKKGCIQHWKNEIENFNTQIKLREIELKRRNGDE